MFNNNKTLLHICSKNQSATYYLPWQKNRKNIKVKHFEHEKIQC